MKQIETSREQPRGLLRGVLAVGLITMVIVLGALVYLTPLKTWLAEGQQIKHELEFFGLGAPYVFTIACALLIAIGVPRLPLCSLGGMIFGFTWGLLWTHVGTVLGAYLTFLFVRWRGRDYTLQHFPRLRGLSQKMEGKGLMAVLLARQLPVNGLTNHLFLGLSPVSHRDYLLGTFLGFLPQGATACLVGAGLIRAEFNQNMGYLALGVAAFALLGFGLKRLVSSLATSKIA